MARNNCSATDDTERTWPEPPQTGHFSVDDSSTEVRMRWRDISSRPKCEMAADLDTGAVVLESVFEPPLHGPVVAAFVHVDEVDDDEAGQIAQTQAGGRFPRPPRNWS